MVVTHLKRILCWLLLTVLASHAAAQPGRAWLMSLESLANDSTQIVKGKVTSVESALANYSVYRVKMSVSETLRGVKRDEISFNASIGLAREGAEKEFLGKEVLAFLVKNEVMKERSSVIAELPGEFAATTGRAVLSVLELSPTAQAQVLTMGLEPLSKPEAILSRTREAIKEPRAKSDWNLTLPPKVPVPPRPPKTGMGTLLSVPVDGRLEKLAKAWIASPDGEMRKLGVGALAFFKSEEGIKIIRALLDDRYTESFTYVGDKREEKVRVVREAAKDVLDSWDISWEPVHAASIAASREMVRIPAGAFIAGGTPGAAEAGPQRQVDLAEFWIGKTSVTVGQYRAFCKAAGYDYDWKTNRPPNGYKDDHPMTMVTWNEANAFCQWAGGSLPTEDQWEKAARGTEGLRFPWGEALDSRRAHMWVNTFTSWRTTAPVGSYPSGASPYGCLDIVGNSWQWCAGGVPTRRPSRGGGYDSTVDDLRFIQPAGRGYMHGDSRLPSQGFRVAGTKKLKLP